MNKVGGIDINGTARFIASVQKDSGEIPWSVGGKTDLWDHVESAMGLTIGGLYAEARRAYLWARETQLEDGSWWSATQDGRVTDSAKESNFAAYIAVGILHYYLVTTDIGFVRLLWETITRGISFALSLQAPSGEIYWAKNAQGEADKMALLTGSCSVMMSLKCAMLLGRLLGEETPEWLVAAKKLQRALRYKQERFNLEKARFSMDWYYPVLCGALSGRAATSRIAQGWDKFFQEGAGVRCVCEQPWATMAETAELVLSLCAMGDYPKAHRVFGCLPDKSYGDGSFWMGVTFPDGVIWPEEKTSWTAGAILMAADALYRLTPAHGLFYHRFWRDIFTESRGERARDYRVEGAISP